MPKQTKPAPAKTPGKPMSKPTPAAKPQIDNKLFVEIDTITDADGQPRTLSYPIRCF